MDPETPDDTALHVAANPSRLSSGRVLAANTLWNLAGQAAPLVIAVAAIPLLLRYLGIDRVGLLSIGWAFVGSFSLFDLGLGRAITKLVAVRTGEGDEEAIPALVWTGLVLMFCLGLIGSALLWPLIPALVSDVFKVQSGLRDEARTTLYILASAVPLVTVTAGLRGVLEARQRFRAVSTLRIITGAFTFASPVAVLPFATSLVPIVTLLVATRLVTVGAHYWLCVRAVPAIRRVEVKWRLFGPLLKYGSWITVANVIVPLLLYIDRFFIGALASLAAVAFYATPYEVVSKILLIPSALVGVLFPAFAASFDRDRHRSAMLFGRALRYTLLIVFPFCLFAIAFASVGLNTWLGPQFASRSTLVTQLIAVAIFVNSLAFVPYVFLQACGRPDLTAKVLLVEVPLYVVVLYALVTTDGIVGAALAFCFRAGLDALLMLAFSYRLLGKHAPTAVPLIVTLVACIALLLIPIALSTTFVRVGYALVVIGVGAVIAWRRAITPSERAAVRGLIAQTIGR